MLVMLLLCEWCSRVVIVKFIVILRVMIVRMMSIRIWLLGVGVRNY